MEAVREITDWDYNHVYLLDGNRAVAYIPAGSDTAQYFEQPLRFDRRGRRFERVSPDPFRASREKSTVVEVQGSRGETYYVNREDRVCTCPGFTFRGQCRHVNEI